MRRVLLAANLLIAAGALLLAVVAANLAIGLRAQARSLPPIPTPRVAASPAIAPRPIRLPDDGEPAGRLEIPRLGLDLVVIQSAHSALSPAAEAFLVILAEETARVNRLWAAG